MTGPCSCISPRSPGALAAFTRYRMGRRVALPSAEQAKFAPRGEGNVAGTLDPRAKPAKA